jgi:cytosine permease
MLVITKLAADAPAVFGVIGASFGPICGAMCADYLLAGKKWAGPRAGFNPAGWISWLVGFLVGGLPLAPGVSLPFTIPCPPLSAFIVGFVLYYVLAKAGMESKKLDMPQRID